MRARVVLVYLSDFYIAQDAILPMWSLNLLSGVFAKWRRGNLLLETL